jgi:hypothetical protein
MGSRKLSGVINMKNVYSFKLEEDQYEYFVVIEYINGNKNAVWTLEYLLDYYPTSSGENELEFPILRAKYWLKENYPELMI